MSIIISKKGASAQKIDRVEFEKEDYLQNYIHENPESIPVYEIEADKKLLVVAREFETESGPIDALAIDKDGDLYIVETKLYKNPDKRTVVAQALDYGASLWKHLNDFGEFIRMIDVEIQNKFHLSLEEKIKEFYGVEQEEIDLMLEKMRTNLKEGNIKFVILMDSIDERLKDLIIYVNQNSQFDIYAVQLEYYKFSEYEIMIPKLFGVEVKKNIKGAGENKRMRWTEDGFIAEVQKLSQSQKKNIMELFEFTKKVGCLFGWGTGQVPTFSFKVDKPTDKGTTTVFSIWGNGSMDIGFWLFEHGIDEERPGEVKKFFKFVEQIDGIPKLKDGQKGITFKIDVLNEDGIKKLKEASLWLKETFWHKE